MILRVQDMLAVSCDSTTLLLFHQLVHRDERVTIEPWREEPGACGGAARRRRAVVYKLPMRGPAWFRRLCGAPVTAKCRCTTYQKSFSVRACYACQ